MKNLFSETLQKQIAAAQFFMLRYETEITFCTGITAVSKQERRHFKRGITIAPWSPRMTAADPRHDPLQLGTVKETDLRFKVNGKPCRVLVTADDLPPIFFVDVENRFQGVESPYDLPADELKEDTLYFGLAVDELLRAIASPRQFVWGADWETVPALVLLRSRHHVALTLHNTFDECLENQSRKFGKKFAQFSSTRSSDSSIKTALEIGLETADVVTTVNRGFAWGMRNEIVQTRVMAEHLQPLLGRVVGINNAAFSPLTDEIRDFKKRYLADPLEGSRELFERQAEARRMLPPKTCEKMADKVVVVSMGRRVAQKQHDLLVESTRRILSKDPKFPLYVFFATNKGDPGSQARLERIQQLQEEFPTNVSCTDRRLEYFATLMQAADYNCMPSLYEPHGGAYEGTVIPIARAVDGLAEQICAFHPHGEVAEMNARWHDVGEPPTGFLFRESVKLALPDRISQLKALLDESPSPQNLLFERMCESLSRVLVEAVELRINFPQQYADLVIGAIEKQESTSWNENLGGMLALIEEARIRRSVSAEVNHRKFFSREKRDAV